MNDAMKSVILAAALALAGAAAVKAQDAAAGEKIFRRCLPCHAVGANARNKVGPILNGLDGRKAGSAAGYSYSDANKASGIVWNETTFLDYIRDPRAKIPGTKMVFPGLKNEQQAKDLWAYLTQFKPDGTTK
jgi:cytochrome c